MLTVDNNYGMLADFHCHTIASMHAYSTVRENITAAKKKGLKFLALTDHGVGCPDSPPLTFFKNLPSLPNKIDGIRLLKGVEANIMDFEGNLDMPLNTLQNLDIVVASFHTTCVKPGTFQDHTNAYLGLAKNPHVNIIGHAGSFEFSFDYEKVIPILSKAGKVFEINAHTFVCRKKSTKNCIKIATICKEHKLPVLVSSDAHSEFEVAECKLAFEMLESINFPQELIINIDENRILEYLKSLNIS